jgi:hypothetical protein
MPNFDGAGPLKRGRVIGCGRGVCKQPVEECRQKDSEPENPDRKENPEK